jgi:hypothetical protein
VDDKWVQTPRGIFPLKRFFVGGTVSADGEEVAWDAVRVRLQEIVDHENKQHPFSDDDLVKELAKHGLTVARRTVTKYRKAMNIPSSRQRRDWTLTKTDDAPPAVAANGATANGVAGNRATAGSDAADSDDHDGEGSHGDASAVAPHAQATPNSPASDHAPSAHPSGQVSAHVVAAQRHPSEGPAILGNSAGGNSAEGDTNGHETAAPDVHAQTPHG